MKLLRLTLFGAFLFFISCTQQKKLNPDITKDELYSHIDFLASDSLQGRKPGTPFDRVAAKYIKDAMESSGILLMGKNGYQFFEFIEKQEIGENNILSIGSKLLQLSKDYSVFPFSSSDTLSASIVFVGYGFSINTDSIVWDDYQASNVNEKWAMILRGDPEHSNPISPFGQYSNDRHKATVAKDNGAAGVILVSGVGFDEEDELIGLNQKTFDVGIPVIHLKREQVDALLGSTGYTISGLEKKLINLRKPVSVNFTAKLNARTHIINSKSKSQNVIGLIEGSHPIYKNQYVVLGAHYDHLGMGGKNSSSRMPDTLAVHNGADDNASGIAAILEIGQRLAYFKPQRSIILIAFGAEEQGLIGSRYFTEYPLVPLDSITAMINIDMLGRLCEERTLQIGGVKTSIESDEILTKINSEYSFNLSTFPQGYGPSDHASFYSKDIPVFFFSTGPHTDYHTPFDNIERINFDGLTECSNFIYDVILELANMPDMLIFQEFGPKNQPSRHGAQLKVRLGIMPDVSGAKNEGLLVLAVTNGQPAHLAGITKGDVITAINGKEVRNIQDYMYRIQELKPGMTISVEVINNGTAKVILVQL
jgi:hypothetical protein